MLKQAKILYFVKGVAPSAEDFAEANEMKANVVFRNAQAVPAEGSLEQCDGVAGAVPPTYAKAFPTAAEAIKANAEKFEALAKKVGDSQAPKAATQHKPASKPVAAAQPAQAPKAPNWTPNAAQ